MELFDVVNERNEVIGQRPRAEVHRLGLRHRAAHVLIFNQRGELFLQQRSASKDTFPGAWDSSASGHLQVGESYEACAVREVREELGVTLTAAPELCLEIAACAATGQEFVRVYRTTHEGPFQLHPEEIASGRWVSPSELDRWLAEQPAAFAPALTLLWQTLRASGAVAGGTAPATQP